MTVRHIVVLPFSEAIFMSRKMEDYKVLMVFVVCDPCCYGYKSLTPRALRFGVTAENLCFV
jgi:hypothetical protein